MNRRRFFLTPLALVVPARPVSERPLRIVAGGDGMYYDESLLDVAPGTMIELEGIRPDSLFSGQFVRDMSARLLEFHKVRA